MNKRLAELLGLSASEAWQRPWLLSVDPDPAGDTGGGGTGDDGDDDDGDLGEGGAKALREERALRKQQARELAQLRSQLDQVKGLDPNTFAEAQRRADDLQRQLQVKEAEGAEERRRIEAKANERATKAEQRAQKAETERVALQTSTLAQAVFQAAEGRDGADEAGETFFNAWFAFHGRRHLKLDPATGRLRVVDRDGDPVKGSDGQDMDPVAWLNQQADNSPVVGTFFRAKGGSGSGGLTGARGVRGVQARSVEEARKLSGSALLSEHYRH